MAQYSKLSLIKGIPPTFNIVGESCITNFVYVEGAPARAVYPVVKQVGLEERPGKAALVSVIIGSLGVCSAPVITNKNIIETIFVSKKTDAPLMYLKPDRAYGYVANYLDIRVVNSTAGRKLFKSEEYSKFYTDNQAYLFYDCDEVDLPGENIPDLIKKAPCPVYVSTRKRDLSLFEGAAAIIVSEGDFNNATHTEVSNLIITLGADGASYNGNIFPTVKHKTGDNFGCREVFFAVFSYTHFHTNDFDFSIQIANKAAAKFASFPLLTDIKGATSYLKEISNDIKKYGKTENT